jgi:hypothetical protein
VLDLFRGLRLALGDADHGWPQEATLKVSPDLQHLTVPAGLPVFGLENGKWWKMGRSSFSAFIWT